MNPRTKASLLKRWPWLAAGAPFLLLGADNLIGPALSGQAVQKALQTAVAGAIEPTIEKMDARFDRIDRKLRRLDCRGAQ